MMNSTLRAWTGSTLEFDLDGQATYAIDGDWTPASPGLIDDELYDVETPLVDEIPLLITGCDRDTLVEKRAALDRWLYRAARYQRNKRSGSARELEYAPPGASNTARAEVLGGGTTVTEDIAGKTRSGKFVQKVTARIKRRPVWIGPETTITPDTALADNGLNNFAALPALSGDLPARCKIRLTGSGGNITNARRVLVSLRSDQDPDNFLHYWKVDNNPAGVTITAVAGAISAAANFISGSKLRYTASGTTEATVARWEVTAPASVVDQLQNSLVLVRYRDNASSPNFKLRVRLANKVSSQYVYGPYLTDPVKTLMADSTATDEIGMLEVGQATLPYGDTYGQAVVTLVAELAITPLSAAGSPTIDIDCLCFHPLGESDEGKGLALVEYPLAIGSNRAYLDFMYRQPRAYLANSSDVILATPTDLPEGGEIWLWPQQSGQRLYFAVMRMLASDATHDHTTALSAVLTYRPRYLFWRGTT